MKLTVNIPQWAIADFRAELRNVLIGAPNSVVRSFMLELLEQTYEPKPEVVPEKLTLDKFHLETLIGDGLKIEAIKYVRNTLGIGLWEAKNLVEGIAWNKTRA